MAPKPIRLPLFCQVVDSNDVRNLVLAKMELFNALLSEDLHGASILVFANKSDIQGARTAEEICKDLDLTSIRGHSWHIQACCAITGEGLAEGMDWLANEIIQQRERRAAGGSSEGAVRGNRSRSSGVDEEEEEILDRRLEELQRQLRDIKASPSNRSYDRYYHNDSSEELAGHREYQRVGERHAVGASSSHVHEEVRSHHHGGSSRHGSPQRQHDKLYHDHQHLGDVERLTPLQCSPPGLRASIPHSPPRDRRPDVSPSGSPPLPQESAWLPPPSSTASQLRVEERHRLLATVRELENRCHYYVARLAEVENANVDLERRLNNNAMETTERIRQEHAEHRRMIEEREHEIGVLRHECETQRSVRNREVVPGRSAVDRTCAR
ncbi:ADP-ribosylation factor-like protein 5B [Perkinsus olseni]|uniref:ADP-ribosylation factor-like protein 5B n=1 Tax=Perkinsus olseni TaxID=32597 RepID=A0A7J6N783_PEROL|nr:ADP-ribosylation factor-like protein 5B [Perkinsus olseni]